MHEPGHGADAPPGGALQHVADLLQLRHLWGGTQAVRSTLQVRMHVTCECARAARQQPPLPRGSASGAASDERCTLERAVRRCPGWAMAMAPAAARPHTPPGSHPVGCEVEEWQRVQVLPARVLRQQVLHLAQHDAPCLHLLGSVGDVGDGFASAARRGGGEGGVITNIVTGV